jgi:hypothetical protein
MDVSSFVVGLVVGLIIASLWFTFREVLRVEGR